MLALSRSRIWVAGTVVLCILLALASYFLLVAPKRAEAADLTEQAVTTAAQNADLETRVAELRAQFAELPERQAELATVKEAIPESTAHPTLLRDLDALALSSGATLMSVTPGAGVVVPTTSATDIAAATEPAAEGEEAAADPAAEAAADPAAVAPAGDLLVSIPMSLVVVGDFAQSQLFLTKVQTELTRAFLVTDLAVTAEISAAAATGGRPAVDNGSVTMTLAGSVFVLRPAAQTSPDGLTSATTETPAETGDVPASTDTN